MTNEKESTEKVKEVKEEVVEEKEIKEEIKESEVVSNEEEVNEPVDDFFDALEIGSKEEVENKINEARLSFADVHKKELKKNRIIGIAFMVIMLAVVIVAYFVPGIVTYAFFGVAAFFILILVLTKLSRAKMDIAVGEYLNVYGSQSDSYVYKHEDIKNVKMNFRKKPDDEVIRSLDFKEDVFHIGSRDLIKGEMAGIKFEVSDASIKTGNPKDRKTQKIVFVGKVLNFSIQNNDEGRILLYKKGCGDAEPNKLADVNMVEVDGLSTEWKVYSSNKNYEKVFNKPLVEALNNLYVDETLNDLVISIQKDKLLVGLSYADSLMIIPLESEFKINGIEHYKEDIAKVVDIVKAINKNSYFKK